MIVHQTLEPLIFKNFPVGTRIIICSWLSSLLSICLNQYLKFVHVYVSKYKVEQAHISFDLRLEQRIDTEDLKRAWT